LCADGKGERLLANRKNCCPPTVMATADQLDAEANKRCQTGQNAKVCSTYSIADAFWNR